MEDCYAPTPPTTAFCPGCHSQITDVQATNCYVEAAILWLCCDCGTRWQEIREGPIARRL